MEGAQADEDDADGDRDTDDHENLQIPYRHLPARV
jgi:hypothetical protein